MSNDLLTTNVVLHEFAADSRGGKWDYNKYMKTKGGIFPYCGHAPPSRLETTVYVLCG